jgi:hypothetical protein
MGIKQILLMVAGVISVGLMAYMGVRYFKEKRGENLRAAMQAEIAVVVNEALWYHRAPKSAGGGSGTFTGFAGMSARKAHGKRRDRVVSGKLVQETENGSYSLVTVAADSVVIEGVGDPKGADGINPIKVRAIVKSTRTIQVILN